MSSSEISDWPGLGQRALYEERDLQPTLDLRAFQTGARRPARARRGSAREGRHILVYTACAEGIIPRDRDLMRSSICWLRLRGAGRLAIMPRPRANDWLLDEIADWKVEGINVVVSLLEQHEVAELELHEEPTCCRDAGIQFVSFPIRDRGVPESTRETERLVRSLSDAVANGKGEEP